MSNIYGEYSQSEYIRIEMFLIQSYEYFSYNVVRTYILYIHLYIFKHMFYRRLSRNT